MLKLSRILFSRNVSNTYIQKFATKAKTKESSTIKEGFPEKLQSKKHKIPPHMYIANNNVAEKIMQYINPYLNETKCKTILEMNPGIGLLTRKLIERITQFDKLLLIETFDHFIPHLQNLQQMYPKNIHVKHGDIVGISKLAFQDKMDNGSRVRTLLEDVPKRAYTEGTNVIAIGAIGSYNFFKQLINSFVFQNSLLSYGRFEMFVVVPPPIYIHLTCSKDIGYMIYRSSSILFQILFEYRFIARLPRDHFVPPQIKNSIKKSSKLGKIKSVDPEYLYLVHLAPRADIFKYCSPEDITALWFFIKQNCVSRRNRIIPNLEKIIPGCGPRLIINHQENVPVRQFYPDENIKDLPMFSKPCTTMSTLDFYSDMNIYTQLGDLTPSQMLTLFSEFRKWPEYVESSFLASLESSLLKLETSADEENIEDIKEEEDIINDIANSTDSITSDDESNKPKKITKQKEKATTSLNETFSDN